MGTTGLKVVTVSNTQLSSPSQLVGVRIPDHPFVRELAQACSGPLALTSANVSCQASTLTVAVRLVLLLDDDGSLSEPQALSRGS